MKLIVFVLAAATLGATQTTPVIKSGAVTAADVAIAVGRIPRFTPDKFAALPPAVRDAFSQMACQVPQITLTGNPANVVEGELAAKGQRDWAAFCSNATVTEIRIVWGGPVRCEDRLASVQDADSIVAVSPGVLAYSRRLVVAGPEQVSRALLRLRLTLPETPSHDALEDGPDNARLIHYCTGGRWQLMH